MLWYAGTSGFSYPEWLGSFYPAELPKEDMLAYYAQHLPAVEINNTFYRMPRTHVITGWRDAVPPQFQFVIKASQRITHQARLKDADESVAYLIDKVRLLGPALACVLFQLPPYLRLDLSRLQLFQALLPADIPVAFEFRHVSWHSTDVFASLRAHNHGICVSDDGELAIPEELATNAMCYLRLRRERYSDAELRKWIELAKASSSERVYAFFKHEDDGGGPPLAQRFLDLANGVPVRQQPRRVVKVPDALPADSAVAAVPNKPPGRPAKSRVAKPRSAKSTRGNAPRGSAAKGA